MDRLERRFFDALMKGEPEPHNDALIAATKFDACTVAAAARVQFAHRDALWGLAVGLTALVGVGFAAWYTPTNTVTVTERVETEMGSEACRDAMRQAGAMFDMVAKISTASGERDKIEHDVIDALNAVDRGAFDAASAAFFEKNDEITDLVGQASEIDLATSASVCNG